MALIFLFVGYGSNVSKKLFTLVALNIPFFQQKLHQFKKLLGFLSVNVNDQVYIVLHVSTDIAQTSQAIHCLPLAGRNVTLQSGDLSIKIFFMDTPKIMDHSLETSPREGSRSLRTLLQNGMGFFIVLTNRLRNIIGKLAAIKICRPNRNDLILYR